MKRLLILLTLLLPWGVAAQTTQEWAARVSVEGNYKIAKGIHLYAEEEIRTQGTAFDNVRTTLGFTYKPFKQVKLGIGYTLINQRKISTGEFKPARHRVFADVSGTLKAGYFHFTLKERFQLTHRSGVFNVYQNTPNAMALKSKLTVTWRCRFIANIRKSASCNKYARCRITFHYSLFPIHFSLFTFHYSLFSSLCAATYSEGDMPK